MFLGRRTRVCPKCIKEEMYYRKKWDLFFYTCCPKHNILLVETCKNCNKQIVNCDKGSNFELCECGFDLRESDTLSVSNEDFVICNLIDSKLLNSVANSPSNNPLYGLELRFLLYIMHFFCIRFSKKPSNEHKKFSTELPIDVLHEIIMKVFNIFDDWPNNFYGFLENYRKIPKTSNLEGIKYEFGHFYRSFFKTFDKQEYLFLKSGFERYLLEIWDGGHLKRFKSYEDKSFITADEARIILKTNFNNISDLIKSGEIEGVIKARHEKNMIMVNQRSLEKYIIKKNNTLNLVKAGNQLGLSLNVTKNLLNDSLLKGAYVCPKTKKWKISKDSVMRLIKHFDKIPK